MLLIITQASDTRVNWFEQTYLQRSAMQWRRFNTELYPHEIEMNIIGSEGCLNSISFGVISSMDVRAVWYRRPTTRNTDCSILSATATYVANETDMALRSFYSCLDHALWVDNPMCNITSAEKIRQLREARKAGFRVPDTVVTSMPDVVEALAQRHGGRVITKPLGQGGIVINGTDCAFFSSILDIQQIQDYASSIRRCQLIFQEPIPKAFELRVTVVGDRCFAVQLDSQVVPDAMVDWRKSAYKIRHTIFDLPEELSERCIRMIHASGLHFSAFDLIVTPGGEYVFLEHNPNGQFAWLEEMTGIPIGNALIELFAQAMK